MPSLFFLFVAALLQTVYVQAVPTAIYHQKLKAKKARAEAEDKLCEKATAEAKEAAAKYAAERAKRTKLSYYKVAAPAECTRSEKLTKAEKKAYLECVELKAAKVEACDDVKDAVLDADPALAAAKKDDAEMNAATKDDAPPTADDAADAKKARKRAGDAAKAAKAAGKAYKECKEEFDDWDDGKAYALQPAKACEDEAAACMGYAYKECDDYAKDAAAKAKAAKKAFKECDAYAKGKVADCMAEVKADCMKYVKAYKKCRAEGTARKCRC